MAHRFRLLACALGASASLSVQGARADLPPLAAARVQYLPSSEVADTGVGAQVTSYDLELNLPLVLGERTFLIPGVRYHLDHVRYSGDAPGFVALDHLHGLDVPVVLAHRLSEEWALAVQLAPGLAGDLDAIDSRVFHLGALGMLTWSRGPELTLGGGVVGSYAFGELLPLPMAYVDWRPAPWFRTEASLPWYAGATFGIADRVELGAQADVSGNHYAVREPRVHDRPPCVGAASDDPSTPADETQADRANCVDSLAYSVVTAGAVARVRLGSTLWLGGFLGHTLYRRFEQKNPDGEIVAGGKVELPDELVVRFGLEFRVPEPGEPATKR